MLIALSPDKLIGDYVNWIMLINPKLNRSVSLRSTRESRNAVQFESSNGTAGAVKRPCRGEPLLVAVNIRREAMSSVTHAGNQRRSN